MSIPYQIGDLIDWKVMRCKGQDHADPVADVGESQERTLDVLLRAWPTNGADPADESTWIFVGDSNQQVFPLTDGQSVNVRVSRRNQIYFRGPLGHRLVVVTAQVAPRSK